MWTFLNFRERGIPFDFDRKEKACWGILFYIEFVKFMSRKE